MKKLIALITICTLIFCLAACSSQSTSTGDSSQKTSNTAQNQPPENSKPSDVPDSSEKTDPSDSGTSKDEEKTKTLVVYFSCTGNTKAVAEKIIELTGADVYEIVPKDSYTDADLNYNNNDCRANKEMNDPSARPAIGSEKIDVSSYDTVIIGYPIWWGTMPRIINTFFDTYDLSGKTILPFCTSGGSGVSKSVSDIKAAVSAAEVKDGLKAGGASDSAISRWLSDNGF